MFLVESRLPGIPFLYGRLVLFHRVFFTQFRGQRLDVATGRSAVFFLLRFPFVHHLLFL